MKTLFLFISLILLLLHPSFINSQLTFTNGYKKVGTSGTGTATTSSNGILLHLQPTVDAGMILSDALSITTTPLEFYVTLIGTTTAVDFGLQQGTLTSDFFSGKDSTYSLIGNNGRAGKQDFQSLMYPGSITGTTTSSPYIPSLNQVIKFTLTKYSSSNYFKVEIQGIDFFEKI